MQSQTWKTLSAVVITAIIVGGGVYFWQQQKTPITTSLPQEPIKETIVTTPPISTEPPSSETKYENSTYRFSLTFPASWGEVKETITDDQLWKDIKLTAKNDAERYIEIHVVATKDKDNWMVTDFEHTLLSSNAAYSFYYIGSAENAGKFEPVDQKLLDLQKEVSNIGKTFKLL